MISVNVVEGGETAFDALVYPAQNPLDMEYYNTELNGLFSKVVDGVSQSFINGAKKMYDTINNSELLNIGRAALANAVGFLQPDVIVNTSVAQLNNATAIMQRYIMAEPTLNKLYLANRCDGFYETFVNNNGTDVKDDNYDYRRVMDGVLQYDESTGDAYYNTYSQAENDMGENDLSVDEQFDLLSTWDNVAIAIASGDDPSNSSGGKL